MKNDLMTFKTVINKTHERGWARRGGEGRLVQWNTAGVCGFLQMKCYFYLFFLFVAKILCI